MKGLLLLCVAILALSESAHGIRYVTKTVGAKVYAHLMPWFETKESQNSSVWGQHWTMVNQNPDIVDGTGRREIAAWYYPEIHPYASGDVETVEYQLLLMKYSGIDGILLDWPGTTVAWDYVTNKENCEAIIRGCEQIGLEFAIVYEDHNVGMAAEAGFITDRLGQAQKDMIYLRDNYFPKSNYIRVNGAPLLLDFGPQTFQSASDWLTIFEPFPQKPTFLTLWNQMYQAEGSAAGEYPWIYVNYLLGLNNFYKYREIDLKFGVAYPGFKTFYAQGGWPGNPGWEIPVELETFTTTFDLALEAENVNYIQLATWNDYGEGTIVEPTREFGNAFLNVLQTKQGLIYGDAELELVKDLHSKRLQYKGRASEKSILDRAAQHLIDLEPEEAAKVLRSL